jgi:23S rRNA pseudouridine2457 synthase
MHRYFVLNKPRDMVSQFVSPHKVGLLGDIGFDFPEGTHAIGRLDNESEGLLLLTTDKKITRLLFLAQQPHERKYLVMVQHEVLPATFKQLEEGITIPVKNGEPYIAKPVSIALVKEPEKLYPFATDRREIYPHTWLLITLTEGKFRQVRKMVLAARHRCLRLIRLSISSLTLGDLVPGEVREMSKEDFYKQLHIQAE